MPKKYFNVYLKKYGERISFKITQDQDYIDLLISGIAYNKSYHYESDDICIWISSTKSNDLVPIQNSYKP